jgi:hypothetical protein
MKGDFGLLYMKWDFVNGRVIAGAFSGKSPIAHAPAL